MTAPVALAYVSLPAHVGPHHRAQASAQTAGELAEFASQEGYALATLFVDVRGRSAPRRWRSSVGKTVAGRGK